MVPRAPITTGTVVVLSSHIRSTSISKSLYCGVGVKGYSSHVNEKACFVLLAL